MVAPLRYMVLLMCLLAADRLSAQNDDSLFVRARNEAFGGRYDAAIPLLETLLEKDSMQSDYRIFLARVYYWKADYTRADSLLAPLTGISPPVKEAVDLHEKVLSLDSAFERQIALEDRAVRFFPDFADEYRFRKAIALKSLGRNEEALRQLDSLSVYFNRYDIDYLRTDILSQRRNTVSAGWLLTVFSPEGWSPWNFFHAGYEHRFTRWSITGRVNYGRLYGSQALQAEADAYVRLRPKSYLYLNTGVSDRNAVFPAMRFGAEYYADPRKFLSVSIGARYLHFSADEVVLLTGHAAWNVRRSTFSYRPFVLAEKKVLLSHVLAWRKNLLRESYVQLELQYGTVPYYFYTQSEFVRTGAYRAGISGRFRFGRHFFVQPVLMYEYEEYLPGDFRNRFNMQLILAKRF